MHLILTHNLAFAWLIAQISQLLAQFLDYTTKIVHLDNASAFMSQAFNDFCMSIGITVEQLVAHVHTQNGLVGSFINYSFKCIESLADNLEWKDFDGSR